MRDKGITEFFEESKPAFGSYDLLRKLPNYIDGLKVSQRKLLWTGFSKARDFIKTDSFANLTTVETAYVHGSGNLCGVCDSLVQEFVGANNYQLFEGNTSGWGCRINPVVSAPRYTRLRLSKNAPLLFEENDLNIVERQYFEQQWIEPRHLMPVFPVLFLNGSSGISLGFSCTIYPRNPRLVIDYIKKRLSGVEHPRIELAPWFRGFTGKVVKNAEGNYESHGVIVRHHTTSYSITEIPVGMDYQKYVAFLDKLCDDKVIVDYEDCCEPKHDTILFKIKTTRQFTSEHESEESLLKVFRLTKSLPENLNCIDENNKIREFNTVEEILEDYIRIRKTYYEKRKDYLTKKLRGELDVLISKYVFCDGVVNETIRVTKVPKDKIIENISKIEKIVKVNDSYDYLLRIPIVQLTKEKLEELEAQIRKGAEELKRVMASTVESMWTEDLKVFSKNI